MKCIYLHGRFSEPVLGTRTSEIALVVRISDCQWQKSGGSTWINFSSGTKWWISSSCEAKSAGKGVFKKELNSWVEPQTSKWVTNETFYFYWFFMASFNLYSCTSNEFMHVSIYAIPCGRKLWGVKGSPPSAGFVNPWPPTVGRRWLDWPNVSVWPYSKLKFTQWHWWILQISCCVTSHSRTAIGLSANDEFSHLWEFPK